VSQCQGVFHRACLTRSAKVSRSTYTDSDRCVMALRSISTNTPNLLKLPVLCVMSSMSASAAQGRRRNRGRLALTARRELARPPLVRVFLLKLHNQRLLPHRRDDEKVVHPAQVPSTVCRHQPPS
jgi:hypothetical protein